MQVTKYTLVFVCPVSKKFIFFASFFLLYSMFPSPSVHSRYKMYRTSCVPGLQSDRHCAQKNKCTVYTLLKSLHLASLSQKMYVTHNNKGIDAYLYTTISELIYNLFMYQISLYILYEQNSAYLFLVFNFFLYIFHILLPKPKCKYTLCS